MHVDRDGADILGGGTDPRFQHEKRSVREEPLLLFGRPERLAELIELLTIEQDKGDVT